SLKWALFENEQRLRDGQAGELHNQSDFEPALAAALHALPAEPAAVCHRIVAAGAEWVGARRWDAALAAQMRGLIPLAPDHLPQALAAVQTATQLLPRASQWACSDSGFHRNLPAVARSLALPRAWTEAGIRRFGYHGLSCESALAALQRDDPRRARGRIIIAHLGSGCSLTAVRDGRSCDTSMGFTPLGGVVMATRSGDLDPGVLLYLLRARGVTPEELNRRLNHESGLRGVSGISGDMKTLLADARPEAAAAVDLFVYSAKKCLGAMAAALGGVDIIVFTGGIGEHAGVVRERIGAGMEWLGAEVKVVASDEEGVMTRHTLRALAEGGNGV
ncbi:MAG TPA: acetate kinase, partial [Terriglobales bacterium]|nr:acetate kinase [Terriglobales bacterium]